jgi:hypothetical protein
MKKIGSTIEPVPVYTENWRCSHPQCRKTAEFICESPRESKYQTGSSYESRGSATRCSRSYCREHAEKWCAKKGLTVPE